MPRSSQESTPLKEVNSSFRTLTDTGGETWQVILRKTPPNQRKGITMNDEREAIRKIWRPLYELGTTGQEQISGEYMAHLISAAVDETQQLIKEKEVKSRQQENILCRS